MFSLWAQLNPSVSCFAARFPELKSLTSIVNSPSDIFTFLNYSNKFKLGSKDVIQEAQAEFSRYLNSSTDNVHQWIWLYWDFFSIWTNECEKKRITSIEHNGQLGSCYLSGSHPAVSTCSISGEDHQLRDEGVGVQFHTLTKMQTVKKEEKKTSFIHLGTKTAFRLHFTAHSA